MEQENYYLTQTPVKKLLLKFAIPCVLAMLVSALYNIVDQIFLGNSAAGQDGIMATTIVFPFTVVALALAQLVGDGCAALYSISLGAKDTATTKKCIGNALLVSLLFGLVLMLVGFVAQDPILKLLGVSGYSTTTQQFTRQYMTIILAGIPFYIFASAMASIIRADGSPQYSMLSTVVGAVINLILDPIFIFACGMGVQGAALATIIGQVVAAVVCAFYFRKMKQVQLERAAFKPDGKVVGRTLRLGISSFITQIAIAIITIVANNVVGAIGGDNATDAGAALGIVFKVFAIVLAFALGIAVGAQPIIGYNYGAQKPQRVLQAFRLVILCNVILGIIATILFEAAPSLIVAIFGQGSDFYKEYAVLSFRIYLGGILFCCLQKASCILLQSINRPYKALVLSLMRDVILLVPGVCLLGLLGNLHIMLWAGIIADVGAFIPTIIFVLLEMGKLKRQTRTDIVLPKIATQTVGTNLVVTIGREFGSGGKYIGQELAKRLKVNCYDNELITQIAADFNWDAERLKTLDEKQKSSFWYGFASTYAFGKNHQPLPLSPTDNLFLKQCNMIEKLHAQESCVIIGRCADFILQKHPNVIKIFVYATDPQFKIHRKVQLDGCTATAAAAKIKDTDQQRAAYYHHYTAQTWGDKANYDLCIDTATLGVDGALDVIENYIKQFRKTLHH
ncbi:MAG: MATE family efflux transporter [Prevotella sp.]|nr:MATE family efflux transporter [Prevotella sp.]